MDEARRVAFLSSPCSLRNIVQPYAICCASFEVIAELVTLSAFIPKGQGEPGIEPDRVADDLMRQRPPLKGGRCNF